MVSNGTHYFTNSFEDKTTLIYPIEYFGRDFTTTDEAIDAGCEFVRFPKVFLTNAIPNSFLPEVGKEIRVIGISKEAFGKYLNSYNYISTIKHLNIVKYIEANCALNSPIPYEFLDEEKGILKTDFIKPLEQDIVLTCCVEPPKRLAQGIWQPEDFPLMKHKFLKVIF
jgi:hypothetical protein